MDVGRRDPVTGRTTTGHEWNGIEELNTPVPKVVLFFLAIGALFCLGYWLLMPAWPLGSTYTKGLLGNDQRRIVDQEVATAKAQRAAWLDKIQALDFAAIKSDPVLMQDVTKAGHVLFSDNCAACHGIKATGGPGFPDLTAKSWLWGGESEKIAETIGIGINSTNDDTRVSQMLAFGRDGILDRQKITDVVAYVRSLSMPDAGSAESIEAGREVFAGNCVACHGKDAKGMHEQGAPDLTDSHWIYGGTLQDVYSTVYSGRQGHMPNWNARLTPAEIKLLALYVGQLGQAK
ncbi:MULTISPECIES: cytochrome-c oxidase, cbb3-type subunit III [Mesorhizobium]|uniref:cytochrome-c oxidase, cbb3-type subunit III n=1 Tax=Mesorhizobium TaxID=68287 RepID=UPI000FCBFCC6|nr:MULTISPECIES: cytochrome-c oxidase, cbb3-type subunit III [Mesorhizobium]RVC57324.1 cytochrome-c oxidase, cbb3-type subunit III [Mesorhizobium sp. M4B.F.Ca.ET.088.02.2.1]MDX8436120.1 cytochrome-c oxidase, cbb3-type subunit III [Mesorhizobium abyssinicae]RVD27568.1 cytochrome-c oxidase, cbb3-type subunit III [Mesorhizobium sp. M4B.F.Ca.ET.017.02.2.1]RWF28096.1 MAG: cytochrome-c oxidase, cbb3-type subunit III [Mesorhizobium sp.]RWF41082.1 MAG: cytochrome-c oxidase, cbb3-type subunit III [Meso